jgi:hypothetical protein
VGDILRTLVSAMPENTNIDKMNVDGIEVEKNYKFLPQDVLQPFCARYAFFNLFFNAYKTYKSKYYEEHYIEIFLRNSLTFICFKAFLTTFAPSIGVSSILRILFINILCIL